jgi:hypothetical protein
VQPYSGSCSSVRGDTPPVRDTPRYRSSACLIESDYLLTVHPAEAIADPRTRWPALSSLVDATGAASI